MNKKRYFYLIKVQYLGFRYSGWQKQPGQKTVEGMLRKTLKFVLPKVATKILGAGRTDAKVSSEAGAFELFTDCEIENISDFLHKFNSNLPADIKVLHCIEVSEDFNVIKDIGEKEYHYYFSYGSKNHPYCAPFMANIIEDLDIHIMKQAASLFTGTHNYSSYTVRGQKKANFQRTIKSCILTTNNHLSASFFPKESYVLKIRSAGFMRYQIRMIMGALIQLGKGELTLEEIDKSLEKDAKLDISYVAPGSGLHLNSLTFEES